MTVEELAKFAKANPEEKKRLLEQLCADILKKECPVVKTIAIAKEDGSSAASKEDQPTKLPPLFKNCKNGGDYQQNNDISTVPASMVEGKSNVTKPVTKSITVLSAPVSSTAKQPAQPKQFIPFKPVPKPSIVFNPPSTSLGSSVQSSWVRNKNIC